MRSTAAQLRSVRRKALEDAVQKHLEDQKTALMRIAQDHHVTFQYITTLAGAQTGYRTPRKPQLQNALVHAKAKEVNEGRLFFSLSRSPNSRYTQDEKWASGTA